MVFSLLTNEVSLARAAQAAGVERILLDLERKGKAERQHGRSLFLSDHRWDDVARIAGALDSTQVSVRINPWHQCSPDEIERALDCGATSIMLPYFHGVDEVERFLTALDGRAMALLLMETRGALEHRHGIIAAGLSAGAEFHVGLNDLSLSLGHPNFWPLFLDCTVSDLACDLRAAGTIFGIGGVAPLEAKELPVSAEAFLGFSSRAGSTRGWLGRSFRQVVSADRAERLQNIINLLRERAAFWRDAPAFQYQEVEADFFAQVRLLTTTNKNSA